MYTSLNEVTFVPRKNNKNVIIDQIMKQITRFAAIMMVALLTMLSSCNKEPKQTTFVGTKWNFQLNSEIGKKLGVPPMVPEGSYLQISFTSETEGTLAFLMPSGEASSMPASKFTYTREGDKLQIKFDIAISRLFGLESPTVDAVYSSLTETLVVTLKAVPLTFTKAN